MDKKYLRDPDGVNLLKKKARAGLLDQTEPDDLKRFPTDGYNADLSKLPKITFGSIWKFMIDSLDWRKQVSTAKPLLKGYNFFMSNHVLATYQQTKDAKSYIKSQVLPSMKKKIVYTCFIKLSSLGFVLAAKCGCPAGVTGRCNHVCATLFFLDSLNKKRQSKESSAEDVSCTSKACQWRVPSKRKGTLTPIGCMKFKKHDYNKVKGTTMRTTDTKATVDSETASVDRPLNEWSKERMNDMLEKLKKMQEETGQAIGWCHILPQEVPKQKSTLSQPLLSPIKENPISLQEIKKRAEKMFVDPQQAERIEQETREQSKCEAWYFHRQPRITASQCYRSAVLRDATSPTKAINDILYKTVVPTQEMKDGLEMEAAIKDRYITKQYADGHKDLSVTDSGLNVGKYKDGFLAASPDGMVFDPSVVDAKGLLEMKYIKSEKEECLEQALLRKQICARDGNGIHINRSHKYFYQIQQGMYLTKRKWTDFVVAGSQATGLYIERVNFDKLWWENVKKKLTLFFERYIVPELAYPKIKFGLPRWEFPRQD